MCYRNCAFSIKHLYNASHMRRKNLKLIAHRVPVEAAEHLRRVAKRRKTTMQALICDAIMKLDKLD